ncbi:aldo/keto reductase family protein [Prevotella corporis]|uniref:aldo/keto reductase family protein n=1 Tax=Prevotella corporis TaxID=28128 RepID=UPI0023F28454|nr:aldo/keto reductase [Prevotella corporis]MDQ7737335.1 aldo/keto reductase [Prevotella corporis]
MEYTLLNNGVKMPMVGLGTFPLKGKPLQELIKQTFDLGYTLYDTAWLYKNERDISIGINQNNINRDELFLTSKLHINDLYYSFHPRFNIRLRSKSVKKAFEKTCQRLGTDYLDLYLIHFPFDGFEWMWEELIQLYNERKVRAIGVSSFKPEHLKKLSEVSDILPAVNQIEISPYNTRKDIIEYCNQRNITVEAYSPFGRGMLTKQILSDPVLVDIAKEVDRSVAQVILRWLYQMHVISIPRSNKLFKLKQNINIFDFELNKKQMNCIDGLNKNLHTGGGFLRIE